jgi:tetratricopeptide (TPR) repeat protein
MDGRTVQAFRQKLIASGITHDEYVDNSIINSPGARIGPQIGLDEKATRQEIKDLLESIEGDKFERALRNFFRALRNFSESSYRVLASRFPADLTLEDVYVPLRAKSGDSQSEPFLLSDAIRSAFGSGLNRVLIEGSPGSGKSTLLRQIARHAWDAPASVGLDRQYIPLPIRLRSYAQAEGAVREERIWRALDKAQDLEITGASPASGFFEAWPQRMGAPWLFLIDGFDEVPEALREEALLWLRRLIKDEATFVLTSRPTGQIPENLRTQLKQYVVQPFSTEQQEILAKRWLGSQTEGFIHSFKGYANGELGGTPLLLTIAAIVYHENGALPRSPSELYREFTESTWREAFNRGAREELGSDLFEKARDLIPMSLEHVALSMTQAQGEATALDFSSDTESLIGSVAELLATKLRQPDALAESNARRLVEFLGTRSGIFRTSRYQCEWLHPTFREFMAARAIAKDATSRGIERVLGKSSDPTWRQIILFLLGSLSERRSVSPEIRQLKETDPPLGLALAGVAISEGASVDVDLVDEIVRDLCEDVRQHAKGWICNRLLSTGDQGRRTRESLSRLQNTIPIEHHIEALALDLTGLALAFGKFGSCAIDDLRQLHAVAALCEIASNESAPLGVRIEAAGSLCVLGRTDLGRKQFFALASGAATAEAGQWRHFVELLSEYPKTEISHFIDSDTFVSLLLDANLTNGQWSTLLDSLVSDRNPDGRAVLDAIRLDERIPEDRRRAVQVRAAADSATALNLLVAVSDDADAVQACIEFLKRSGDSAALLKVAQSSGFAGYIRRRAVRALSSIKAQEQLIEVVEDSSAPIRLRWTSAEATYKLPTTPRSASALLDFYEGLGKHAERGMALGRRAYFQYWLGRSQEAVVLFDKLFEQRPGTAFEIGCRAHCLERLGFSDAAIEQYGRAIDLNPKSIFERSRRAYIFWLRDDYRRAVVDVDAMDYQCPDWFQPYAADILRACTRLDDAKKWLASVARSQPNLAIAKTFQGAVSFDEGKFGAAIRDFESALALDPSDILAEYRLAQVLRVAGRFEEAAAHYTSLLAGSSDRSWAFSERARVMLRLGTLSQADQDIESFRSLSGDEAWYVYLRGLFAGVKGDIADLELACRKATDLFPPDIDRTPEMHSHLALFSLGAQEPSNARRYYDELIKDGYLDCLRYQAIADLDDLIQVLPQKTDAQDMRRFLVTALWPKGFGMESASDWRREALQHIKRPPNPSPMYCQLARISGLEQDYDLAQRILDQLKTDERTILLWNLGRSGYVYGQCNFKKDLDAQYNLKFCDRVETILSTNLKIFIKELKVKQLLFLEDDLRQKFEKTASRSSLKASFQIADRPPT